MRLRPDLLDEVRRQRPLIHHITNVVTTNDCANLTRCFGGLPIMANAPEEVAEMVAAAGALVLNIGTLTSTQVDSMLIAGRRANELGIPIILDPVGAGATPMRTEAARRILDELIIDVVVGNAAEVATLAGIAGEIKGVESIGVEGDLHGAAREFARDRGAVVVVTGQEDWVTDGQREATESNGCDLMGLLVGTGCMSTSAVGCFTAIADDRFEAVVTAITAYCVAGEIAATQCKGPGTFRDALLDAVFNLTPEDIKRMAKVR